MEPKGRVVIVDPAYASSVGHHSDVNAELVGALEDRGWQAECWGDVRLSAQANAPPWLKGAFSACGYEDPRHWSDPGGTVHLARRVEEQLLNRLQGRFDSEDRPVAAWVVHTALPFHLLGLARALLHLPAARLVVSLMFPPGETLEGSGSNSAAESNCRLALCGLGHAIRQGGHHLHLALPSRQSLELYQPLLEAADLKPAGIHPAVVGAGQPASSISDSPSASTARWRVLLHWGDLKAGKGRPEVMEIVRGLLDAHGEPALLQNVEWLFQVHGSTPLAEEELRLLKEACRQLPHFRWLNERVDQARMQTLLAGCDLALLAYDPVVYRHRSSGVFWSYAAARRRARLSATVVGRPGGWLELEARALGLQWQGCEQEGWLECLAAALPHSAQRQTSEPWSNTAYSDAILDESFGGYVARAIEAAMATEERSENQQNVWCEPGRAKRRL